MKKLWSISLVLGLCFCANAQQTNLNVEGKGPAYQVQKWIREKGTVLLLNAIGTKGGQPAAAAAAGAAVSNYFSFSNNLPLPPPEIPAACVLVQVRPAGDVALR